MSPSVQQLSVIGKDTETFQAAVSQDIRFDIFVFTPIERAAVSGQTQPLTVSVQRTLPQVRLRAGRGLVLAVLKTHPLRVGFTNQQSAQKCANQ